MADWQLSQFVSVIDRRIVQFFPWLTDEFHDFFFYEWFFLQSTDKFHNFFLATNWQILQFFFLQHIGKFVDFFLQLTSEIHGVFFSIWQSKEFLDFLCNRLMNFAVFHAMLKIWLKVDWKFQRYSPVIDW